VVILTFSQELEDIARAFARGCDGYRVKPVSFQNLVRVARALREWATRSVPPRIPEGAAAPTPE
jgi:DNA-binding NarL/FixJ family response regulator